MKRLRGKLTYANVMSTLAVFIALGGATAFAASQLAKNSVGAKQLRKNAVATAKIKNQAVTAAKVKKGSLTGTQIKASTLGTVPSAQTAATAQMASALGPSESWREVGTAGQPAFQNNWKSGSGLAETVAFYRDQEGIVHLKGLAQSGTTSTIFALPPGYRPANGKILQFAQVCTGCSGGGGVGAVTIYGPGISPTSDGAVLVGVGASAVSFDGIAFRAGT